MVVVCTLSEATSKGFMKGNIINFIYLGGGGKVGNISEMYVPI